MVNAKKMKKQWRVRMSPGHEVHNEGNELTFVLGMKLLNSQTLVWIQCPQAHTSWHGVTPLCPGSMAEARQVLRHLEVGAEDAEHFWASYTEGCSPFPHVAHFLPTEVVFHTITCIFLL